MEEMEERVSIDIPARGMILRTGHIFRVEWKGIVCMPKFDRFAEAHTYLIALRQGRRLRLRRKGQFMLCEGMLPAFAKTARDGLMRDDATMFDASRNAMPYGGNRRKPPDEVIQVDHTELDLWDGVPEVPEDPKHYSAAVKSGPEGLTERLHQAEKRRTGPQELKPEEEVAAERQRQLNIEEARKAFGLEEEEETADDYVVPHPSLMPRPVYVAEEPLFKYSKEEFYGTDLPQAAPHPDHKKRGRPKKAEPVPELPAMFRKLNGRD